MVNHIRSNDYIEYYIKSIFILIVTGMTKQVKNFQLHVLSHSNNIYDNLLALKKILVMFIIAVLNP